MIQLTIDNQTIEVPEDSTILQAAGQLGIAIPTMCWRKEFEPSTSCMVCVVQVEGAAALVPSCAMRVRQGMVVHTNTPQVIEARRVALELLLSDHVGDCEGPCRIGCPAGMDIPQMLRWIAAGELKKAIRVIKRDIAIPAILGRICPAPCEKVCRLNGPKNADWTNKANFSGRAISTNKPNLPAQAKPSNEPISICLLKRHVADADLESPKPFQPACLPPTGRKAAIVGSGPCGLAAAWHLAQRGHSCTLFEKEPRPGGLLRSDRIDRRVLPLEILDREIDNLLSLDIELQTGSQLGTDFSLADLRNEFDVVFLATGDPEAHNTIDDLHYEKNHIKVDRGTFQTSIPGVFAGGGAIAARRLAVKSVADGKQAARIMDLYLTGQDLKEPKKEFNSRLGELTDEEWLQYVASPEPSRRIEPASLQEGLTPDQARREAARCLQCDCRKKKNCKLRQLSTEHSPSQNTYKGRRRLYTRQNGDGKVIYESGKCISCGLCIQYLSGDPQAVTFAGRGFTMQLTGVVNQPVVTVSEQQARQCIRICPTGAWSLAEETKNT